MLEYFLTKDETTRSIITYSDSRIIKDAYAKELKDFKRYMNTSSLRVNNNNFLTKAINMMCPSTSLDIDDFYLYCKTNIEYGADLSGFVTNTSTGKLARNNFYLKDSSEYFRSIDNNTNVLLMENWKDLKIIKTLYTNNTDINFYSYGLKDNMYFNKFTIFDIDLVELFVAYKYWVSDRIFLDLPYGASEFLATYVYPKVWDTMLDLTIFNRFMCSYQNIYIKPTKKALPYTITNYIDRLDNYNEKCIKYIKKHKLYLNQILNSPVSIVNKATDSLYISTSLTGTTRWILWISRLKIANFLTTVVIENSSVRLNREHLHRMSILYRRYNNGNVRLPNTLPMTMMMELDREIEKTKNYISS